LFKRTTIFIDLDGTLIDSLSALYVAYTTFLHAFEKMGSRAEFEELNGPSLEEIVKTLKDRHRLPSSHTTLLRFYRRLLNLAYAESVAVFPESSRALQRLSDANYTLALVTSCPDELLESVLKRLGLEHFFSIVVSGTEVNLAKPHPKIYQVAIAKANSTPSLMVAIEDSPNGIKSAKAAGLKVYAVNRYNDNDKLILAGADQVFENLSQVATAILEQNSAQSKSPT
jgi:beta-phosphoglucomutase-like phosphatase (HAD superfamily)